MSPPSAVLGTPTHSLSSDLFIQNQSFVFRAIFYVQIHRQESVERELKSLRESKHRRSVLRSSDREFMTSEYCSITVNHY